MTRWIKLAALPSFWGIAGLTGSLFLTPANPHAADCANVTISTQSQRLADLTLELDHARRLTRLDPSLENTGFRVPELKARWKTIQTTAIRCLELDEANAILAKAKGLGVLIRDLELSGEFSVPAPPLSKEHVVEHLPGALRGEATNDQCALAIPVTIGTVAGTTVGATNDGSATCGASLDSPDVWFKFTQTSSGIIAFDTKGSDFDTVVSIHTGCPGTPGAFERLCNDDALGSAAGGAIWVSSGEQLWFRVAGYNGATGNYQFTLGEGGAITGTVTSEDPSWIPEGTVRAVDENGYSLRSAGLANDGTFAIAGLDPGSVLIKTEVPEHLNEIFDDVPCLAECFLDQATPLPVGAATVGIADFELGRGGILRGTVLESGTNNPLSGVQMDLRPTVGYGSASTLTNNDGTFSFLGLSPGQYRLLAVADDHADEYYTNLACENGCDTGSATPIAVDLVEETSNIDFLLDPLGSISGIVTDEISGDPLESALVSVYHQSNLAKRVFTNENGEYSVGLGQGTYFLLFSHNGYRQEVYDDIDWPGYFNGSVGDGVVLTPSQDLQNVDAALTAFPTLRGTLTSSTGPLSGSILVTNEQRTYYANSSYQDGTYEVEVREPGNYYVYARASNYSTEIWDDVPCPGGQGQCPTTGASLVTVGSTNNIENIDFNLELSGSISGQITDSNGQVTFGTSHLELYRGGSLWSVNNTYSSSFNFTDLPPGTYSLLLTSDYYEDQLYSGIPCVPDCDPSSGTPLVLAPSQNLTANFTLIELGRISGTVIDDSGVPVPGTVNARSLTGQFQGSGDIAADGSYIVRGLPAADYYLWTSSDEYQSNTIDEIWDDLACLENCPFSGATPINLAEYQLQAGFDFVLATAGTIEGEVTETQSGAVIQATVTLYDDGGSAIASQYGSNFSFRRLLPGNYFLLASGNNHAQTAYESILCPPGNNSCDPTIGSPIPVTLGSVSSVNLSLQRRGGLSGVVASDINGIPTGSLVELYSEQDPTRAITSRSTDGTGAYSFSRLQPGTYYAVTAYSNGFIDESYNNIPCPVSPPQGCDPTKGTPIEVLPNRDTRHIDFELRTEPSAGYGVLRSVDGAPIPGSFVDIWDLLGAHVQSVPVEASGSFELNVQNGSYYLSSDAGRGFMEEVHEDIECPLGSAYSGNCDPTDGSIVEVDSSATPAIVIFELSVGTLFSDGFENGDTSAWTTTP